MFGGAINTAYSPHLRKSGSRPVFTELGDLGGSAEEGFLHSSVATEMKGVSTPLSTAVMMPSPAFLWRFKIGWDSVMRMSAELRDLFLYEAFLYYNPLLLMALVIWLWGANLWVFSQANVNYAKMFDLDQYHMTHREIWKCAIWMTIIVPTSMTAYLYLYSHNEVSLAASQPAISFSDFFVADIMTSMAKVFSDLERSACRMLHGQVATIAWFEADSVCGSHSVAIPLVLVLPYIFRLFQCLRQYKDTGEKSSVLNALKYSTAVPVIFLSALKYHVFPDRWTNIYRPLWLLSSLLNSMYSFYWDVNRDWDLRFYFGF
ncbi:SPX and EXS domain-containing protein [Drosera capensis]